MANLIKWSVTSTASEVTFMSTTLAALASSTLSVASSTVQTNSSQLRIYSDWELLVGTTAGAFGVGAFATLYIAPTMGTATNYAEADTTELQPLTVFPLTTSTANAQHRVFRQLITVPPHDFQVYVFNGTTQAWSTGSGANTLKVDFYDVNSNG